MHLFSCGRTVWLREESGRLWRKTGAFGKGLKRDTCGFFANGDSELARLSREMVLELARASHLWV